MQAESGTVVSAVVKREGDEKGVCSLNFKVRVRVVLFH